MGKGTIVGGGTDGLYSLTLDFGAAARAARVSALDAKLAALVGSIAAAQAALDAAQVLEDVCKARVQAAIAAYVDAAAAMAPALQAVTDAAAALVAVQADDFATPQDIAAAQAALTGANAGYGAAQKALTAALAAYTKAAADLMRAKEATAKLRVPLDLLKATQVQLGKDRARWAALVLTQTLPAWCVDLTKNATGVVATVEIPGENALVLIAPAGAAPTALDGLLTAREVQSPGQVFWNAAVLPGWQKFKPTYRTGIITALDTALNTAAVTLEAASSSAQSLNVNQATELVNVPVQYMTCNAQAFDVGDACVVKFEGQDWAAPKVIGFKSHPKTCAKPLWILITLESYQNSEVVQGRNGNVAMGRKGLLYKLGGPTAQEATLEDQWDTTGTVVVTWNVVRRVEGMQTFNWGDGTPWATAEEAYNSVPASWWGPQEYIDWSYEFNVAYVPYYWSSSNYYGEYGFIIRNKEYDDYNYVAEQRTEFNTLPQCPSWIVPYDGQCLLYSFSYALDKLAVEDGGASGTYTDIKRTQTYIKWGANAVTYEHTDTTVVYNDYSPADADTTTHTQAGSVASVPVYLSALGARFYTDANPYDTAPDKPLAYQLAASGGVSAAAAPAYSWTVLDGPVVALSVDAPYAPRPRTREEVGIANQGTGFIQFAKLSGHPITTRTCEGLTYLPHSPSSRPLSYTECFYIDDAIPASLKIVSTAGGAPVSIVLKDLPGITDAHILHALTNYGATFRSFSTEQMPDPFGELSSYDFAPVYPTQWIDGGVEYLLSVVVQPDQKALFK